MKRKENLFPGKKVKGGGGGGGGQAMITLYRGEGGWVLITVDYGGKRG